MTVAEGSKAARYGVARLSLPWALGELRDQRRTVLSSEQERKVSEAGERAMVVTGAVCARK